VVAFIVAGQHLTPLHPLVQNAAIDYNQFT